MSGGSFGYVGDYIGRNVFNSTVNIHYRNIDSETECRIVRILNPMDDREVSELLYDIACLLHSAEWYKSCDIGEETYRKHLKQFKAKWFNRNDADRIEGYKNDLKIYYESLVAELERSVSNE